MRRREKFLVAALLLSAGLFGVQYTPLDFRYLAVAIFCAITYGVSAWALADDLLFHEWFTIVPFPALYAGAVALFYFLLPSTILSQLAIIIIFGVGMYGQFLTANIYSVAKGRTIQLLHAAHAIGLLFTLITSLLFANTIFLLRLPFFVNGLLVSLVHFPLIFMSLWSINLEPKIEKELVILSLLLTLFLGEIGLILSFLPLSVWNSALFIMSFLYIGLGVLHNHLRQRLFTKTLREYTLVAMLVVCIFLVLFPLK